MEGFDRRSGLVDGLPQPVEDVAEGVAFARSMGFTAYVSVPGGAVHKCFRSGYSRAQHITHVASLEGQVHALLARVNELELVVAAK